MHPPAQLGDKADRAGLADGSFFAHENVDLAAALQDHHSGVEGRIAAADDRYAVAAIIADPRYLVVHAL